MTAIDHRRTIPNEPDHELPPVDAYEPRANGRHQLLPHDLDAEKALLGAAMLGAADVLAEVPTEAFYLPAHGHLAQAITAVADGTGRGDAVLVADWLASHGLLDSVGGTGTLAEAMRDCGHHNTAPRYAELVLEHWRARRLITAARELEQTVRDRGPQAAADLLMPLLEHDGTPADGRLRDGTWLLDAPTVAPAIWGRDQEVLWAEGEPLLLTGPPGVGKTTLIAQLLHARLGLSNEVLGWPVVRDTGRVLYLASDRPQQIRRALARCFTADDHDTLRDHLTIWPGPPPTDISKDTATLVRLARQAGATTVILDSLKDMAIGLSDDEVGAGVNNAMQRAIAEEIEIVALHHQRKGHDGKRPKTLEDLYGSVWIPAGAGSVLLLWGQAGDLVVELHHLKQPSADVGPLKIEHDHHAGTSKIHRGYDLHAHLRHAPNGLTTLDVARAWLEKDKPTDNERKKAQRRLDNAVRLGQARRVEPSTRQADGTASPARYYAIDQHTQEQF